MAQIIERLSTLNLPADTASVAFTSDSTYLASVIATNKSSTQSTNVSVWIAPLGNNTESVRGYIAAGLTVTPANALETIRFAVLATDLIYVQSTSASTSFIVQGIDQLAL